MPFEPPSFAGVAQSEDINSWENRDDSCDLWPGFLEDDNVMPAHAVEYVDLTQSSTQGSPDFTWQMETLPVDTVPAIADHLSVETFLEGYPLEQCNVPKTIIDQFSSTRSMIDFDPQQLDPDTDISADPIQNTSGTSSSVTAHHPTTPEFVPGTRCTCSAAQSCATIVPNALHSACSSSQLPSPAQSLDVSVPATVISPPARSTASHHKSPWNCPQCNRVFKHPSFAERKRHEDTHNNSSLWYECCCGYKCRGTRKDNYRRHLNKCTETVQVSSFKCKCKMLCRDKMDHVRHIGECGVSRRPGHLSTRANRRKQIAGNLGS